MFVCVPHCAKRLKMLRARHQQTRARPRNFRCPPPPLGRGRRSAPALFRRSHRRPGAKANPPPVGAVGATHRRFFRRGPPAREKVRKKAGPDGQPPPTGGPWKPRAMFLRGLGASQVIFRAFPESSWNLATTVFAGIVTSVNSTRLDQGWDRHLCGIRTVGPGPGSFLRSSHGWVRAGIVTPVKFA